MAAWYNSLSGLQRFFAFIAVPSTAILLLQTILLLFGIGDGESDGDIDTDSDIGEISGGDDGLLLFSVRGIVAMLCIGGWSGIVLGGTAMNSVVVVILSTLIGLAALFGMAFLIKLLLRLQSSGNISLSNAIGKAAQVYLTIPAMGAGVGKIHIVLQDTYTEVSAITRDASDIKTGEMVRVVATDEVGILVVERLSTRDNKPDNKI